MKSLLLTLVKATSLIAAVYFSTALAIQINLGGDVEYWLSLFIATSILVFSLIEWHQKKRC